MEKDLGRIKKNPDTDIILRVDDFGGKRGLTIREFVNRSDSGFTGFTKSGTRIPAEHFEAFKAMINAVHPEDMKAESQDTLASGAGMKKPSSIDDVPEEDLM